MRWMALALVCLALTGCLFASDEETGQATEGSTATNASDGTPWIGEWHDQAVPEGPDHAHVDPLQHRNLTTPNFEVLGWDPLITERYNATTNPAYCASQTTQEDREYVAVTGGFTDVAITVVDVTDPREPRVVGELELPRSPVIDVDFVDETPYVALATLGVSTADDRSAPIEGPGSSGTDTLRPLWRDACGEIHRGPSTPLAKGAGVVLVDLSNMTNPTVEDHVPQPIAGPHNVFADTIDGEPMVVSSVVNFAHSASYFNFYRVDDVPQLNAELVDVGTYSSQAAISAEDPPPGPPAHTNVHVDAWMQRHPVTNETIAYLANWNGGIVLLEYGGPHQLEQRAVWNDYQGPATPQGDFISLFLSEGQMTGQWHRAQPIEATWNGSHYTVIHQEVSDRPSGRPTGVVGLLDTSDPGKPVPVAAWTLPVDPNWTAFKQYSPHYLTIQDRSIFVALGHGGVWALDASSEHWPHLRSAGLYVPARKTPAPPPEGVSSGDGPAPYLGDIQASEGVLVTSDRNGVYTVAFDSTMAVPHPEPWHEEGWSKIPGRER